MTEHRQRMALEAQAITADRFEILAITAGVANGWEFQPETLKSSLALWEGVNCFIDHDLGARSVRDIAGVLRKVEWDPTNQGIKAEMQAFGPSKALLKEIGRQVLEESDQPAVKVGFSADILFRSKGKQVEEILKVYSVDLVYNPARGGVFLRALNQLGLNFQSQGGLGMQTFQEQEVLSAPKTVELTEETQTSADLQTQLAEMRKMRAEMSVWLAETMLGNSQLPMPVKERLRKQFGERTFAPAELQTAIRDARSMLMELDPGKAVNGPARIEGMVDSGERVQAAVDDLFGAPRAAHLRNVNVPRLSGIRELYLSLTGDTDLHGGYHPERAQLATTVDFSGLVKNSLNKLVSNTWEELGKAGYDWWKDITVQEHFNSLHDIAGTLIGTVGDLPTVAEGANYPELKVGDSPESAKFTKYGGYIPLTLELIDRDETRKLRAYARELASAGMRKISRLVSDIFTSNAGVGPMMVDGGNLFNADLVATESGHANMSVLALSQNNWDAVSAKVYKQPMLIKNDVGFYGTGPMMAVNPKFLLVSRANQKSALEICTGALVREASYVYDNVLKGSAVPVVVPEWTDDNDWAAVCDPRIAPAIFIAERFGIAPEIFIAGDELSPAVFSNDEHRLKVRHFLAVWVNDFRPLHKCNVV
jgi:hypothetical protein